MKGTPVVGANNNFYLAAESGSGTGVYGMDSSGTSVWTDTPLLNSSSQSSPTLGCLKDGTEVVGSYLYVGDDSGNFYSFITDSKGLNTTSSWPKFHRDQGNTADASKTLTECP